MRLSLLDKPELEASLGAFLGGVARDRPVARAPLAGTAETLRAVYDAPDPRLAESLRACMARLMAILGAPSDPRPAVDLPVHVLGAALVAHNGLAPLGDPESDDGPPPALAFTHALLRTLPQVADRDGNLAWLAVTAPLLEVLPGANPAQGTLVEGLITRSPLIALWAPHLGTPAPLHGLARELLPGWTTRHPGSDADPADVEAWLAAMETFMADPVIGRAIRNRWQAVPETHVSCRTVGLVLEHLRRTERHRDRILEFYESYCRFSAEPDPAHPGGIHWPITETLETLLRTPVFTDAVNWLHRRGNHYIVKFWPLLRLVAAEGAVPPDYRYLSPDFVRRLHHLSTYATVGGSSARFGGETFESR